MAFLIRSGSVFQYSAPQQTENGDQQSLNTPKNASVAFFIPDKQRFKSIPISPEHPSYDHFFSAEAPGLIYYRHPLTRKAVIDYFISLTGSEEVALPALYYSDKHNVPILLSFSLMHTESRFQSDAINQNPGSIDRGQFQLNNRAFPHLYEYDFFDPDLNARYGVSHLRWCLDVSADLNEALAIYNAGYGKVKRGIIPESTREYIQKIYRYQETLRLELFRFLNAQVPEPLREISSLP